MDAVVSGMAKSEAVWVNLIARRCRKSSEICRPRQAGELQTHESFVAVYIYFPLPYFRW
jgi:hypothetical protein